MIYCDLYISTSVCFISYIIILLKIDSSLIQHIPNTIFYLSICPNSTQFPISPRSNSPPFLLQKRADYQAGKTLHIDNEQSKYMRENESQAVKIVRNTDAPTVKSLTKTQSNRHNTRTGSGAYPCRYHTCLLGLC